MDRNRRIVGYAQFALGAMLIVSGLGLTVYQFAVVSSAPAPEFATRGVRVGASGVSTQTTYVDVLLIAVGAFLALSSALVFRRPPAQRQRHRLPGAAPFASYCSWAGSRFHAVGHGRRDRGRVTTATKTADWISHL
ncbi:MAG: hypothetical protein JSR21_04585 [Proteobacteria bacterium]|nr:hypothetical protein [Pseudomonadota bacterium]